MGSWFRDRSVAGVLVEAGGDGQLKRACRSTVMCAANQEATVLCEGLGFPSGSKRASCSILVLARPGVVDARRL